ncbi:hypothetical protein D3C81_1175150 [compost metagenome]
MGKSLHLERYSANGGDLNESNLPLLNHRKEYCNVFRINLRHCGRNSVHKEESRPKLGYIPELHKIQKTQ